MMMVTLSLPLTAPLSSAANATAPPGSTTNLKSCHALAMASSTASSRTATPPLTCWRLMGKVMDWLKNNRLVAVTVALSAVAGRIVAVLMGR